MKLTSSYLVFWNITASSVLTRAWKRFERDVQMTVKSNINKAKAIKEASFQINFVAELEPEAFRITVDEKVLIEGADDLGIIYALLYISENFLHITPFWYWMDQNIIKKEWIDIPDGVYLSPSYQLRYRGWFINDEVLLDTWGEMKSNSTSLIVENRAWEMAMEALLRLGGNMVIPGTDYNSHIYRELAVDMGLWVTHHHAEPLGAQMFARAYPELTPSYDEYPALFQKLWANAIQEQKKNKTIWNLGFRGQGDTPFWEGDPSYNTPEKRGALISHLIMKQYEMVASVVEYPVFCTNLYGEIMELYEQGHIEIPEDVIYIWADNGYGKMVSRRQGNHDPRITALPNNASGHHGVYYHASFYDLQAAAYITMLPNGTEFIGHELDKAMQRGVQDFIIVNCSNVRPHTYILDYIAQKWGKNKSDFAEQYFPEVAPMVRNLYQEYFKSVISFGINEDNHAGEQFYHYTMRILCFAWILGKADGEANLFWLTGECDLARQFQRIERILCNGIQGLRDLFSNCQNAVDEADSLGHLKTRQLIEDSLLLQAVIHYKSANALLKLCNAFELFEEQDLEQAFVCAGDAVVLLNEVLQQMKVSEHGKWSGYYANECLTDIKFTVYSLETIMRFIRNKGEGPHYYQWALKYFGKQKNDKVVLITNMRNHPLDWELYTAMKSSI